MKRDEILELYKLTDDLDYIAMETNATINYVRSVISKRGKNVQVQQEV